MINRSDRLNLMDSTQATERYKRLSATGVDFIRPALLEGSLHDLSDTAPTRPVDEATGLPLCFIPNPNIAPIVAKNYTREADWDHQYTKVETRNGANPILDMPFARYALMHLRLQWSTYIEHHDRWNDYDMIGPVQPANPQQLAATVTFGLSDYIPKTGIILTSKGPKYCDMSDEQRKYLSMSGQVKTLNTDCPIAYLRWFVTQQDTDHIRTNEVDEFLHTPDAGRRIYLAHALAAKMVERAVEPFDATYCRLFTANELYSMYVRNGLYVPGQPNPRDLLQNTILAKVGINKMMNDLRRVFLSPTENNTLAA